MKKRSGSGIATFFLITAGLLLIVGVAGSVDAFGRLERFALVAEDAFHAIVIQLALCVAVAAFGSYVLAVMGFRELAKRREERWMQEKNDKIEALLKQTRELAHHQRLETIGTLTASIAHEFNNLLTPIMGYSLLALEKLPEEETEVYDGIVEIYEASRKAKSIISRLSDLARKNSGEVMRPISLDDLVQKTLDVAAPAKPEGVQIKLDLNCWDQRFVGNEIQINQLLLNLILNSFHAIGEAEGILTIHTSFDERNVLIRITDTGCGIPEEIRERIFEPFFTTKEAGKGTGLGLAIAAQVIEEHHGSIDVKSTPGTGTAMTIRLPRAAEQI